MNNDRQEKGFLDYIDDPAARRLIDAMEQLMESVPFDEISMSDILKLLDSTLMRIPEGMSYKQSFFDLHSALKSCPAFFRNALSSNERDGLKSYIFTACYRIFDELMRRQGMDMDSTYYRMLLIGYLSGSLEITCIWVERGMKEPLDELFRISYELMPHEIRTHLALAYM